MMSTAGRLAARTLQWSVPQDKVSRLSAVEYDGLALTTIRLANNDLSTDLLNGALLFLARPGYNGNRHMEAVVVDSTANSIVVEDLTGDLFEALGPEGRPIAGFVPSRGSTGASLRSVSLRSIFAFNDSKQANAPTYQTQGRPTGAYLQNACHFAGGTSAPSYASSQTTFTDADADDNGGGFASWMIGSILVPDVNIGAPLIITGATATTLTVAGDARGVASNGVRYLVYAAPFTDPVRGTWQTDPHKGGTRYLWAGYRYQPPQMGFWVDPPGAAGLGVYGAATGTNRLGQYYCWNRTYDISTGRWTTPDPVATPWWNLFDYCISDPVSSADANGLYSCDWCLGADFAAWLQNHKSETYPIGSAGCERLNRAAERLRTLAKSSQATRTSIDELASCMADINEALVNHGCAGPNKTDAAHVPKHEARPFVADACFNFGGMPVNTRGIEVGDEKEFVKALDRFGFKIRNLTIFAHGNEGHRHIQGALYFYRSWWAAFGYNPFSDYIDIDALRRILKGRMAKPCTIDIVACSVGNTRNQNALQRLSDETGCTIRAFTSYVAPIAGITFRLPGSYPVTFQPKSG